MEHIIDKIINMNIYSKIIAFFIILYLLYKLYYNLGKFILYSSKKHVEAFKNKEEKLDLKSQKEQFITLKNNNIYDNFYSIVYDDLMSDDNRLYFEKTNCIDFSNMNKNSKVLDIGCANGHLVNELNKENINCIGLDKSQFMINRASLLYPNISKMFKTGDGLNTQLFMPNSFSHILCLYFTIYEIQDKKSFLQNCYLWLKPGGYLSLHLVNRNKFNPIVNAGDPLEFISPQKYAKNRITNSIVEFKNFSYTSNFSLDPNKNNALFEEIFEDQENNKTRKHEHKLYMPTQKEILSFAKQIGFIMEAKIDMVHCQYEYQYIYVLKKPN